MNAPSEILDWQLVNTFEPVNHSIFIQFMNEEDKASVHFNGDPKLLTLHDDTASLESANIASHPSNPGAIKNSSGTLTDYLSSTEEPLVPTNDEERPKASIRKRRRLDETKREVKDQVTKEVITGKKSRPETKGFKPKKTTPKELARNINHIPDIPTIWQHGDGSGASDGLWKEFHDYYGNYEMDVTDAKSIGNTFPPANVLLSDWWVGNVLQSALGGRERGVMWPCDFNAKGCIRPSRKPKGRAYKQQFGGSENVQKWYYTLAFSQFQLHGKEGLDAGQIAVRRNASTTKKTLHRGHLAVLQNDDIPSIASLVPGTAEPDKREIKEVEAEPQEPKTKKSMTKAKDKGDITLESGNSSSKRKRDK